MLTAWQGRGARLAVLFSVLGLAKRGLVAATGGPDKVVRFTRPGPKRSWKERL